MVAGVGGGVRGEEREKGKIEGRGRIGEKKWEGGLHGGGKRHNGSNNNGSGRGTTRRGEGWDTKEKMEKDKYEEEEKNIIKIYIDGF